MKKIISILLLLTLLASCKPTNLSSAGEPSLNSESPENPSPSESPPQPSEIIDLGSASLMDTIHIDQLGYRPTDPKKAVLLTDSSAFSIARVSDGAVVLSGEASESMESAASKETVRIADFSALTEPGDYVVCADGGKSYPFTIEENPYGDLRKAVLEMFNYQKCGVDLDAGLWSHAACHTDLATIYGTDEKKDVSGGWHDAGDYGRYIVPAAKTVADLLLAYEFAKEKDSELLDIVWFEIEWMLKMQDEATGGVYHKVSCKNFNSLTQMPEDEKGELVLCPISATATADFAATMALASRFYPDQKDKLLTAALSAWEWCTANPNAPGFKNPEGITTGEYGDGNSKDERFWAACELYVATGDEAFHDILKNGDHFSGLGWADMGTYGLAAYLFNAGDKADKGLTLRMKNALLNACQNIMTKYEADPYGVSLGTAYVWGSNMTVANNTMTLLLGCLYMDEYKETYTDSALEHMHYLLGKNALSQSYITGFAPTAPQNPHHRPSVAKGSAVPGMVVGGPDMNTNDDGTLKANRTGEPPMKCYIDHKDSYASNEITIYWNSPVYFMLAVLGL